MVGFLEVWNEWFAKLLVRGCSQVDGSLAIGVRLEGRDGVVDERVRCEMLDFIASVSWLETNSCSGGITHIEEDG